MLTVKKLCILVAFLFLAGCQDPVATLGEQAPELAVLDASGQQVKLADLRGKPVVVEFWNSKCGPCLMMLQALQKYQDENPGKIQFVFVGIPPEPDDMQAFQKKLQIDLPLQLDQLGISQERYQVQVTPSTFVIDADGVLRKRHFGYRPSLNLDELVTVNH
ncbi:TlpA family protein disulfide reductase [Sansalvadorimonas verongulae]|uniref:TlpA family protein disulfide reductase n=1 Tax=Sansalvadorimonas verongulae TaxID=2172824 RepID=UPI0018AD2089|nr:TlpA disulfide reductase family protein [Sansalvadorimonas verongulae]